MYEQIRYEVQGPMGLITLHRPDALNAWTDVMAREVREAVDRAAADPEVVAIVVTGAGRAFCAGADLGRVEDREQGRSSPLAETLARIDDPAGIGDFDGTFSYLMATEKPVIAAINGALAGMAFPFVLCCDLRFMSDDAVMLTAFAQRGLIAEFGLSWLLPRQVGPAVALDLLFSSRRVDGPEAARLGLVNASMAGDQLLDHCRAYVQHLADTCSPTSMAVMKRQVYEQLHRGLGAAEADAFVEMAASFRRPDAGEGVMSFLEKRPPSFARLPTEATPADEG